MGPESVTTITVVLVAPPFVGTITNTATVDPNNAIFEADETNNIATESTLVSTGIDLAILKTDVAPGFDPIATSGTQTYTITVDNLGPQDATNIRVRDTLPANTRFRSVVGDNGFSCSHSNGVVECFGGSILGTAAEFYPPFGAPGNDTATIVIRVFAQPTIGSGVNGMHNEARVDPNNEIAEVNENNNIDFEDTDVVSGNGDQGAFNQLTIAKTQVSPANPVARNAVVTYNLAIGNPGTDPAVGVVVRDFLPAGARYISATGASFICSELSAFIQCVGGQIAAGGHGEHHPQGLRARHARHLHQPGRGRSRQHGPGGQRVRQRELGADGGRERRQRALLRAHHREDPGEPGQPGGPQRHRHLLACW